MRPKNGNGSEPAYRRIQGAIRQRIERGSLKPGDVVDSERELAKVHDVSLMTARHALADLVQARANLAACGLVAALIPARRAASIDPMQALRTE